MELIALASQESLAGRASSVSLEDKRACKEDCGLLCQCWNVNTQYSPALLSSSNADSPRTVLKSLAQTNFMSRFFLRRHFMLYHIHISLSLSIYTHIHICIHVCIYIYMYTYIDIYIYIYIYTYVDYIIIQCYLLLSSGTSSISLARIFGSLIS